MCALRVGERHRLGFRGFAISRLAGFREIPRSRIILRHLQEPCHDAAPLRPPCLCPDPPRNELLTAASSSPRAPRYRSPGRGWLGAPGLYSALVWSHGSANYLDPVSRRSLASLLRFVAAIRTSVSRSVTSKSNSSPNSAAVALSCCIKVEKSAASERRFIDRAGAFRGSLGESHIRSLPWLVQPWADQHIRRHQLCRFRIG